MMNNTVTEDLKVIAGKYHKTGEPYDPFKRMAYHGWECDSTVGLDDAEMDSALGKYIQSLDDTEHALIKAKAFAFVLDNMRFTIDEHDYFPCFYNWSRPLNKYTVNKWLAEADSEVSPELKEFRRSYGASGDMTGWMDYDHSVPDWKALYELGFTGIRERAEKYRDERIEKNGSLTESERAYFDSIEIEYSAILRLIGRLQRYAESKTFAKAPVIAKALAQLAEGAPATLYERLLLIYIYFILSECVDSYQVRSLGSGLDYDMTEPYRTDLASGRFTQEELDGFIAYFLYQFAAIDNYWGHPLYIGGANRDGSTRVSEVSMKFLEIYDELGIYNPKIQVKYSKNTPREFLEKILDMIRRGHSCFVFVCEDNVRNVMISKRNIPFDLCYDFDVKGCYEYAIRGKEFSTGPNYINLLGPVVRTLNAVSDDADFDGICDEYKKQTRYVFEKSIEYYNQLEKKLGSINPAPMLSATVTHSLETARDAYFDGADYITTVAIVGGIGSAVDSLMALKTLVYDEKAVSLAEFKRVLKENWSDTNLRMRALNCRHKFGCGDSESDMLAREIMDIVDSYQGIPNSRGGYWKATIHSARQYIELGKKTPATPDGRLNGEETSKNASPTQGMDKKGVTALIRSACSLIPDRFTEGFGFDVMLHESAVKGEDGLAAMYAILMMYEANHGNSIQFNVFSAETLRAAQKEPVKYQNLQIRVCGWNVLWNSMPESEQNYFIRRAENIQ